MKQLTILILMLLVSLTASAQQYAVYRVKGSAALVDKQKSTPLYKGKQLAQKNVLRLEAGTELKLFCAELHEMITLTGPCAGSLSSLMASQKEARQSMTQQYFDYIVRNLSGHGGSEEGLQGGRTTAIFRDDTDSLLTNYEHFPLLTPAGLCPASLDGIFGPKPEPQWPPVRLPSIYFITTPKK